MKIRALAILMVSLLAATAHAGSVQQPSEVLGKLESHFQSLQDYECVMESEIFGKKPARRTLRFWFRKPNLVRIKVEKGKNEGSLVSLSRSGKVRGCAGGLLRAIKVSLSKTDNRLRGPDGTFFYDTHLGSYCTKLRELIGQADRAEVTPGESGEVRLVLHYRHPATQVPTREIWSVDSQRWLLTGVDTYENGTLTAKTRWRDYEEDRGLKETFFDL